MTDEIIKKVCNTISSYSMISDHDAILLSLSGGPDSTFLAYFFHGIKQEHDLRLYAFHLDHCTRSGESKKDAFFVKALCRFLRIELFTVEMDVLDYCEKTGLSFQEGARNMRKKLLLKHARLKGIHKIALGHNADDNVETFLMNLIRGSGATGLSSIKPVEDLFIRPLIHTSRKDIDSYLKEKKIPFCTDKTNLENIYLRNKIRNDLIPYIQKNYSDFFKSNVLKSIEVLRDEDAFFKKESKKLLAGIDESKKKDVVKISVDHFTSLDIAMKRRLLIACIEKVKKNLTDISFKNIEDILKHAHPGGEHKKIFLKDDLMFLKQNEYFYFFNKSKNPAFLSRFESFSEYFFLKIDNLMEDKKVFEFFMEEIQLRIIMRVIGPDELPKDFKSVKHNVAYMDYDRLHFPLTVRNWKKGDRFIPLGMKEPKKVHDFFIDLKIAKNKRCLIPIFSDNDTIIWVAGYRLDERIKISQKTKKILYIKTDYKR
jgi:tRNA(Ile)-lysidine synthase